jgi:hypothetical protein
LEIHMKFAIKSLAAAAALVAGGSVFAQTVTVAVPNVPVTVADPGGSGRVATFKLLSSYSGGNVLGGSFTTGGDLIFSAGTYVGGTNPSSISAISGTLGALNVGKVNITGAAGITVTEQWRARNGDKAVYPTQALAIASLSNPGTIGTAGPLATTANTAGVTRVAAKAGSTLASVSAITTGPNTGNIQSASAVGKSIQTGTFISGTLTGGNMVIENIRFDIANKEVHAKVSGTFDPYENADGDIVPSATTVVNDMVLWTFAGAGDITGPTRLNPASILSANPVAALTADGFQLLNTDNSGAKPKYTVLAVDEFANLQITAAGRQFFIDSLGLGPTGVGALDAVNSSLGGWGKVASNLVFEVQEVPEPSTYALMGLGLVGISLVARRRSAAK